MTATPNDSIKSLPHLPLKEFRALSDELTPRIVAAIRPDDYTGLPKATSFAMKPILSKNFKISKESSQNELITALTILGVYGQYERAAKAALIILELPTDKYWIPVNSFFMMAVSVAYYFAKQAGDPIADELAPHVIRPADYVPSSNIFNGRLLTPYLDEPFPYGEYRSAYPKSHEAVTYTGAIPHFIYLWLFGGSDEWPVARLESEIERYRQAIFQEDDFTPLTA